MYKILICDNDGDYIKQLKGVISECCEGRRKVQFLDYSDGKELLENLPEEADAIFLNAKFKEEGMQVYKLLRRKKYHDMLVLYAENDTPAADMIKVSPYRYLAKNMPGEKLTDEMKEIVEEMDRNKALVSIEASYQREKIFLRTMDIVYFTHHRKGSIIHLTKEGQKRYTEGNIITTIGFKDLYEVLYPVGFIIPHNSYLVNLRFVTKYNLHNEVFELENKMFPISRRNVVSFAEDLRKFKNAELKKHYYQNQYM